MTNMEKMDFEKEEETEAVASETYSIFSEEEVEVVANKLREK